MSRWTRHQRHKEVQYEESSKSASRAYLDSAQSTLSNGCAAGQLSDEYTSALDSDDDLSPSGSLPSSAARSLEAGDTKPRRWRDRGVAGGVSHSQDDQGTSLAASSSGTPPKAMPGIRGANPEGSLVERYLHRNTQPQSSQKERAVARLSCRASDMEVAAGNSSCSSVRGPSAPSWWPREVGGEKVDDGVACSPAEVSELVAHLEACVGREGVRKARQDQHAKRKPIACGMPLITGHSCDYACRYCYIQDWYAFVAPTPSTLTGEEVLLALLYNPHWVPSRDFVILGDVCDPFHPNLCARTLEYIETFAPLRSPLQFCTKSDISEEAARTLGRLSREHACPISALITITTLHYANIVEPQAPSPTIRLETMRRLAAEGLKPFLFMRPLLPGKPSEDYEDVLQAARDAGAVGVIVGSLRVSRKIYRRLKLTKGVVDIESLDAQLHAKGIKPEDLAEEQVDIQDEPLRAKITAKAKELGLVPVRRACCANAWCSGMPCRKRNCLMRTELGW
eukprot:TRINITY_DN75105_c0_g1_i1.p1 TRINITY_DN75105_c0_g1~~TRINITY_DN75105_c0_g1_i1.p1  ORF type:complete len:509 (-),score=47.43 TRINITY_DN75105_c0_g1_i1:335-1861(-)